MAVNGLVCAEVLLKNYLLAQFRFIIHSFLKLLAYVAILQILFNVS